MAANSNLECPTKQWQKTKTSNEHSLIIKYRERNQMAVRERAGKRNSLT